MRLVAIGRKNCLFARAMKQVKEALYYTASSVSASYVALYHYIPEKKLVIKHVHPIKRIKELFPTLMTQRKTPNSKFTNTVSLVWSLCRNRAYPLIIKNYLCYSSTKYLAMKRLLLLVCLAAFTMSYAGNYLHHALGTCTGAKNCTACKNCKYCKHCAKEGKSCGVCKKG